MKRNHFLRLFLTASLLMLVLALVVSCGDKNPTPSDSTEDSTVVTTVSDESKDETVVEPDTDADIVTDEVTEEGSEEISEDSSDAVADVETESETLYDIVQKEVIIPVAESYFNVKDYGAKGDGTTDDSAAIQAAVDAAQKGRGVLYFPEGDYLVGTTITVSRNDGLTLKLMGNKATLIGSESLDGTMLLVNMKYHFYMVNMNFVHNGSGSCLDALFINARNCRFTGDAENTADVVAFHGSDCRFDECSFDVNCAEAYALTYTTLRDEAKNNDTISINDYIVDNVFRGVGKGILVGDGDYPDDGRCEGLKINGNYFYNTGSEQIRVTEILHINIAHNVMLNCTGTSIVLTQKGHGADGVFINDNRIENNGLACIASEAGENNYVSSVNINNNLLIGGQYGVYDPILFSRAFVRENQFKNQTVAGYYTGEVNTGNPYYLFDNVFTEGEGVYSLQMNLRGRTMRLARNIVSELNSVNSMDQAMFESGCTVGGEKGDNVTRLEPTKAPDTLNSYKGEEDIGNENPPEEETEAPMNVPIISNEPVEAPMWHQEGGYSIVDLNAMHITNTVTMHFAATASFDYIRMINPSWGDNRGSIHAELYAWTGDYDESLAGEPIAVADWINFNDNANNKLELAEAQPAGQYLMVMSIDPEKVTEMVGFYVSGHKEACMRVYVDGVPKENMELNHTFIHYVETPETTMWPASKGR